MGTGNTFKVLQHKYKQDLTYSNGSGVTGIGAMKFGLPQR
jgi:hypothetical protein